MTSARAVWGLRIGLSAATAALILVGASLNASGRVGWATALAGLAGLVALAAPDQHQFVPQTPGVGLEHLHPLTLNRQPNGAAPLLAAIESGKTFSGEGNGTVKELFSFLPDDLHVRGAMAVPMPIGDRVGGFVLLGRKAVGFGEDDRRLATTLTIRAGAQLASAHAVALSQKESARYSLMNELVKEASGKTMQEVLQLVLDRGKEVIHYD